MTHQTILSPLISGLQKMGTVRLFGSALRSPEQSANDLDFVVVVSDGQRSQARSKVTALVEGLDASRYTYIEDLLSYDSCPEERRVSQFIHILLCEETDLASDHPIVDAVRRGIRLAPSVAA